MRIDRLVIADGERTFTLPLHPRVTVVTGAGPVERELLTGELVGALGHGRPQVHLEVSADDGRRLAIYRPAAGRTHVIDVSTARDVSRAFARDGQVDLWHTFGVDGQRVGQLLRLRAADLTSATHSEALVQRLAQLDQGRLWSAAATARVTDEELAAQADANGSLPADAQLAERVEQRHSELEAVTARARTTMRRVRLISALAIAATLLTLLQRPALALPGLAVALVAFVVAVRVRRRTARARAAAQAALEEVGADSYLAFHLHRVSGILAEDQGRRRLLDLARDAREAAAAWAALVGDVTIDWAMEHQEEIRATAAIHQDLHALETLSGRSPGVEEGTTADLAHALVARLAKLRHLAPDGESFPLLLDEPFAGVAPHVKPALLELLLRSAGRPQLVFLTDDEQIASWARVEVLTGELAVVELGTTPSLV